MFLGSHMSIAGGMHRALERGHVIACETIQVFTKNANRWKAKPLTLTDVEKFKRTRVKTGIRSVVAHDSYLINIASPDEKIYEKSVEALKDELERTELLDIPYLVMHPGSHMGQGEKEGLLQISSALNRIHLELPDNRVRILLETTAGQGTNLGYKFEQLALIMDMAKERERLGVCLDTCHIFASGYDIRTKRAYLDTMDEFDKTVGLGRLFVIHLNDSKKELGSHVDRHEHIGKGFIGIDGFAFILSDFRLAHLPGILETPKEKGCDGVDMDVTNLKVLSELKSH